MSLLAPTISDAELTNISKYAASGLALQDRSATTHLVGEYSQRDMMTPARQTPMISERIMKNAMDQIAFQHTQTPLLGGKNPELAPTPLLGKRQGEELTQFKLPESKRVRQDVALTPLRDMMNINLKDNANWERSSVASGFSNYAPQLNIKQAFSSFLPAPKHTFEVTAE